MGWAVTPVRHLLVPRPADVVILPVMADGEGDNADTDSGTVVDQGNMRPLVGIDDVTGIQPAPVWSGSDIAPAVIFDASQYAHCEAAGQDRHHRIILGGPGVQGNGLGGISRLGICRDGDEEHCGRKDQHFQIVHVPPPFLYRCFAAEEFRLARSRGHSGKQLFQSVSATGLCAANGLACCLRGAD